MLVACLLCACSIYLLHVASSTYAYFHSLIYFHHHHLFAYPLVCLLWASSSPSYLVLPPYLFAQEVPHKRHAHQP
jgi:hypothetical protein